MDNKRHVWDFLKERLQNDFAVAGIMGNLLAESSLRSDNLQNCFEKSLGMTDQEYTEAVDTGAYMEDEFIHDRAGYGLAQWTYWTRKRGLYQYTVGKGLSVSDLDGQLRFLFDEVAEDKKLFQTLESAGSIREASDAFMLMYEKPLDQSIENQATRAEYGQMIFDQFATGLRKLTIYKRLFYRSDCYQSGSIIDPCGVQVHSTGANNPYLKRYVQPDDGRLGLNISGNDHNEPGGNVCASAYIGKLQDGTVAVYQALPWNYRCWLSGSGSNGNANRLGYIGFEICEDNLTNREYFDEAVMGKAVLLTAYLCREFEISVDNVRDHQELHGEGLASDHADITHWLSKFGMDMDNFRDAVKKALEAGVDVTYIDCDDQPGLYDAVAINPGTYLNLRTGPGTNYASIAKIPKGSIVLVLDDSNPEWWKVTFQGYTGYAMSQYLERIDDTPPEQPDEPDEPEKPKGVFIPDELARKLFDIIGPQLCVDTRSENISNIDYQ